MHSNARLVTTEAGHVCLTENNQYCQQWTTPEKWGKKHEHQLACYELSHMLNTECITQ